MRQIIRDRLANGLQMAARYAGDVYVPNAERRLRSAESYRQCQLPEVHHSDGELEWRNSACGRGDQSSRHWTNMSTRTFKRFIGNGASLGVSATVPSLRARRERRGAADSDHSQGSLGESPTSSTGSSREFNKANIRILLASTQADLVPDRPALIGDLDNVNLDNACAGGRTDTVTGVGVTPWAMAKTGFWL